MSSLEAFAKREVVMQFLIDIIEEIIEYFTGGDDSKSRRLESDSSSGSGGGGVREGERAGGASVESDDAARQESEDRREREGEDGSSGSEASPKRPMERVADEYDWEFLSAGESPSEAGSEIRGNIEERAMRLFRDADGGSLTVQMPVEEFQGAVGFIRELDAPDPSKGEGAQRNQGADTPDWASDGADDNFVTPDVEAFTSQSRTLFENMPEELKQRLLKLMRRNGVMNVVINADRAETTALEIGGSPVEVADEIIEVTHRLTSLAETGEAGSLVRGEQMRAGGMIEGEVFEQVACEYCQTEFQAVNRHKCPNCGAPVKSD